MIPWDYLVLAVLQGILEWLPVSSQGQSVLIIVNFFHLQLVEAVTIALFLHLGTMLVVLVRFKEEYIEAFREFFQDISRRNLFHLHERQNYSSFLLLTTVGTAIIAVPIVLFIQNINEGVTEGIATILIGGLLLVTAFLLYQQEKHQHEEEGTDFLELEWWKVLLLGMGQGLAALPGVSRSGTTITLLLLFRVKGKESLKGSFLMSAPAVLGAVILEALFGEVTYSSHGVSLAPSGELILSWGWVGIITLVTFVVGWGSMNLLLELARRYAFWKIVLPLAIGLLILGILIL